MEKVTFKNLIQTSRCVVVADGYYEWAKEEKGKVPYYFTKEDDHMMEFNEEMFKNLKSFLDQLT